LVLSSKCYSGGQIKNMRWAEHVARMGEKRNARSILVENPERKGPHERPRRKWETNIKMNLKEICWECV
jgi:hypothetical protein